MCGSLCIPSCFGFYLLARNTADAHPPAVGREEFVGSWLCGCDGSILCGWRQCVGGMARRAIIIQSPKIDFKSRGREDGLQTAIESLMIVAEMRGPKSYGDQVLLACVGT